MPPQDAPPTFSLRDARVSDAAAIARVHEESRDRAYRGRLPDHVLVNISLADRAWRWVEWLKDSATLTIVAEMDGCVVGFCTVGPSPDPDADGTRVADMATLYILSEHWGHGIGTALCAAALGRAREAGFSTLTLWTLEINDRARAFYEAHGFLADGASKLDEGAGDADVRALRYRLEI